jgi:hypothetical protein
MEAGGNPTPKVLNLESWRNPFGVPQFKLSRIGLGGAIQLSKKGNLLLIKGCGAVYDATVLSPHRS